MVGLAGRTSMSIACWRAIVLTKENQLLPEIREVAVLIADERVLKHIKGKDATFRVI